MAKPSNVRSSAVANGWASGLEEQVGEQLKRADVDALYEPCRLQYVKPETPATYTPDFILPNGIIIETKGRFVTEDRKKHRLIQAQHPALDIRFVFSYSRSKIGPKSKTTYGMWCVEYGFRFADKFVPAAWLTEPRNDDALAAIKRITAINKKPKKS